MKILKNITILLFILLGISCNTDEACHKDKQVTLHAGLYHVTYNSDTNTRTTASMTIDSISVKGIGIDSLLYNRSKKIHSITLPLNKFSSPNASVFEVTFNNITDTITIQHKNLVEYLSLECGCIKTHTIDTVLTTNHFLDSVKIAVHDVNTSTSAQEHIKLYN